MSKKVKLSNRELDVMRVLWKSDKPLAATDIPKIEAGLNVNTVQVMIRNLMKKKYIKVADVVYHNTVLARTFEPVLTQAEFMIDQLNRNTLNSNEFVAALIKQETSTNSLDELEKLIQKQKDKLAEEVI